MNKVFIRFATLFLYKERYKHFLTSFIFIFIIFILSSVVFITSSIKEDIKLFLQNQPDMIVENQKSGCSYNLTTEWVEKISQIQGVVEIKPKVVGRYYFNVDDSFFTIIGVDFLDSQIEDDLKNIINNINLKEFIQKDSILVSKAIKDVMAKYYYKDSFNFLLSNGESREFFIYSTIKNGSEIFSNDLILMDIDKAKEILEMSEDEFSYIILKIPNKSELDMIKNKIRGFYPNAKIITKENITKYYNDIFNYKGGFFLLLYIVVLISFFILIFQKADLISSNEKKEIGILRAIGWSIDEIIKLKMLENLFIALLSYAIGVILSYFYVFYFDAFLLKDIFFLNQNIPINASFSPYFSFSTLSLIFLFTTIPFIAVNIIPTWRTAIIDANEVMK